MSVSRFASLRLHLGIYSEASMSIIRPDECIKEAVAKSIAEIDRDLTPSIGALYGFTAKGLIEHFASCVFVRINGRDFVVTAGHALNEGEYEHLAIGSASNARASVDINFIKSDFPHLDFAIATATSELKEKLTDVKFAEIKPWLHRTKNWYPDRCMILGLPSSKNQIPRGGYIPVGRSVYGCMARAKAPNAPYGRPGLNRDLYTVVGWTGRAVNVLRGAELHSANGEKIDILSGPKLNPPDLEGTSGGAIIDFGDLDSHAALAGVDRPRPIIDGIMLEWDHHHSAFGLRFAGIISALDLYNAWPR